jgi:hypothetical protein
MSLPEQAEDFRFHQERKSAAVGQCVPKSVRRPEHDGHHRGAALPALEFVPQQSEGAALISC